jgi:SAM-dependent methyltransferase
MEVREAPRELARMAHAERVRRKWERAEPADDYLPMSELIRLAERYPVAERHYHYDPESLERRAEERAMPLLAERDRPGRYLEIGAADAMILRSLARRGHEAIGVDINVREVDPRARAAGVQVLEMDATTLDFPDGYFDVVYSFNTFEHLPQPDRSFPEMLRVLRPGGVLHLHFAGLGYSPHGAHMYRSVDVPYITVLFDRATIDRFCEERGLPHAFPWCNYVSVEQFRRLLLDPGIPARRRSYRETCNRYHVRLIEEYLAQFRRAPSFESLIVDAVDAVYERH